MTDPASAAPQSAPAAPAPSTGTATTAAPLPPATLPEMVRVKNKLNQVIDVHFLDDQGRAQSVKVGPQQMSAPLRKDMLTQYTDALVARKHLRLIPVPAKP
jgi:hypothetical protein